MKFDFYICFEKFVLIYSCYYSISDRIGYHFVSHSYSTPYHGHNTNPQYSEPILYNYEPPQESSEEDTGTGATVSTTDKYDHFVAGVENMVIYGQYKENQHLVLLVVQESDGLDPSSDVQETGWEETSDDSESVENDRSTTTTMSPILEEKIAPFPDIFIKFESRDGPSQSDLQEMKTMFNDFVRGLDIKA